MERFTPPNSPSHDNLTMARRRLPTLPPELILLVVDAVLPANPHSLLPPSHISTRTLLSLTRVSQATYRRASQLLRQRCVYLDSSHRLSNVLLCMLRFVPTLPAVFSLRHITSLYLAPFGRSLNDQPTAIAVRELFIEVSETLRRLVVEMPFNTLDPLDDRLGIRRILREGFEQLHKMEEFVCLRHYPTLSVPDAHTDVWRLWPNLKRMVLFGVPVDNHWLWWDIATLAHLEHVVLARPECLGSTNIKEEYFHKLPRDDPRLGRNIKIVLLDVVYEINTIRTERWDEIDPEGKMEVEVYEVPLTFYADDTPLQLVTEWAERDGLNGNIWHWETWNAESV